MSIPSLTFDRNANDPANLVTAEPHDLTNNTLKVVMLNEGSFYSESILINSVALGRALDHGTDFTYLHTDLDVTAITGTPVAVGLNILDKSLAGEITVTYQAVGGYEGRSNSLIRTLIDTIASSGAVNIPWSRVISPATFPPDIHTHGVTSLTELEVLSQAFREFTNEIAQTYTLDKSGTQLLGQQQRTLALIGGIRNDINRIIGGVGSGVAATEEEFNSVMDNFDAIAALTMDQAVRQLEFEQSIASLENTLITFMDQMGDIMQNTANAINV